MNVTVRGYISQFRVRELQAVLEQLGLSRTGRKADLVARIFAFFGEEPPTNPRHESGPREQWRLEAAERAITDTYHTMMGLPPGSRSTSPAAGVPPTPQRPQQRAPGSLSAAQAVAAQQAATAAALAHSFRQAATPAKRAGGAASPFSLKLHSDKFTNARSTAIRCVCNDNADRGHMIQCEGDKCGVWQHSLCVGINVQEPPDHFFCEWCRVSLADPFWEPRQRAFFPAASMRPTKGQPPAYLTPGEQPQPFQSVDKGFMVQAADSAVFRTQTETQLQAVCVQLGDVVPFRLHWPRGVDLRANNMQYRPYGRNPSHKLGNNARDDAANVGPMCFTGKNRVTLTAFDERRYAFGVQLARKRSQTEVRGMMAPPLELPAAVAAVCRAVTGKDAGDGKDGSDSDDFVATSMIISLRCPLSGSRIVTPARFVGVPGLGCFDLDTYLTMAERSRKWQCPHSMRNMSIRELHIDTYVSTLLPFFQSEPDVMEVEVNDKGQWRRVGAGGTGDGAWTDITADPASVPTPLGTKPGANGTAVEAEALSSDSEEESEGAELRAAATAYKATAKRKREEPAGAQDEVIVLSSDSDVETSRPAQRHQTAPLSASQQAVQEMLRIRLPSQRDQQPQQRTPQSVPRQATMAQAFSRANMHVEHHQVNAELRQLPPPLPQHSGWAAQQQQQPVRPNGRLAAGAMPHTSSTTSRPTQAPQPARPPAAIPGFTVLQQPQRQHHYAQPAAMVQPPASGPQRLMPQIPSPSPSACPASAPYQGRSSQQQHPQQPARAWQAAGLPPTSGPLPRPVSTGAWVPQQRPPQPQQQQRQQQQQQQQQRQQAYQPFAPAQAASNGPPRTDWVAHLEAATAAADLALAAPSNGSSALPPQPYRPSSVTLAAPPSGAGVTYPGGSTVPARTAPTASAVQAQGPQQHIAPPRQQQHPAPAQPSAHVWGTPEPAQPPLPAQPPPPLPQQQQQQQQQQQHGVQSPQLPPLPPSAPPPLPQHSQSPAQQQHRPPQAASQQLSGASVQMSPEELAAEAQLALLPDDCFDDFLVDPEDLIGVGAGL